MDRRNCACNTIKYKKSIHFSIYGGIYAFFCLFSHIVEERNNSPPFINLKFLIKLIGGIQVNNRPKRRKYKDNPYTLGYDEVTNKYIVCFKNINGVIEQAEITEEIYKTFDRFELDDLSELNEYDNHIEHSEIFENNLYQRAINKSPSTVELAERNIRNDELKKAINCLSEVQRRRIELYYFEDMTLEEIAKMEQTSHQAVSKSIKKAIEELKELLKNKNI